MLADGDPDAARETLRKATAVDPDLVRGWELLGDTMMGVDRSAARWAYLKALRAMRSRARTRRSTRSRPRSSARSAGLFPLGDSGWERELARFVLESVRDVSDYAELDLAEAAWVELARLRLTRGERDAARTTLLEFLDKERGFRVRGPLAEAVCSSRASRPSSATTTTPSAASASCDWRRRRRAPARTSCSADRDRAPGPWAEDILKEAFHDLTDPGDRCLALLLLGERYLLHEQLDEAERAFNEASRIAGQIESSELSARATMGSATSCARRRLACGGGVLPRGAAQMGDHPELLLRILIRRGDLFRLTRDAERAIVDYERASEGYKKLDLTDSRGWARLRLAQMGVEGSIERAEELFKSADLAAGVAATDALSGDRAGTSRGTSSGRASIRGREANASARVRR
jgi:tetratricopeptide (TPR) repeat protein